MGLREFMPEFGQVIETCDRLVARVRTYSDVAGARVAAGVLE